MRLYFDAVDDFVFALELIVLISRIIDIFGTVLIGVILRERRLLKLKITTIKLLIDEFINELADCLPVAHAQLLGFDVLDIGQRKLLEIAKKFAHSLL